MAQPTSTPATPATTLAASGAGKTTIDDGVVAKIAGIAAREVSGVFALGGGAARVFGAVRDAIGNTDLAQGVRVEVGETQVAADVTIVVEYPQPLQTVADGVRSAVARAITELVGLEPAEINVVITDVHIPGEESDDDATEQPRVR
jgi:uncharacterized alkaline shock family protein YloU